MEVSLKQPSSSNLDLSERGSLLITDITLPLKKEYLRALTAGKVYMCVCVCKIVSLEIF